MDISLQCTLPVRQIQAQFAKLAFKGRPRCPRCGYTKVRVSEKRYRCQKCRRPFSLTSGTWLKGLKLPWDTLYLVLTCWLKRIDVQTASDLTNISYPTAFYWYKRFRQHVPRNAFIVDKKGRYCLDESYFGWSHKGHRGRGAQGRLPVFGVYDLERKDLTMAAVVPNAARATLLPLIKQSIPKGSYIATDKWLAYRTLKYHGFRHKRIDHRYKFRETNPIEAVWSHMKRNLRKMYHHCRLKNLPDYVAETTYRFRVRHKADSALTFLKKSFSAVPNA